MRGCDGENAADDCHRHTRYNCPANVNVAGCQIDESVRDRIDDPEGDEAYDSGNEDSLHRYVAVVRNRSL